MKRRTGGKGGAADSSPLRTRCQEFHGALVVVGADSGMHASAVQGSTMGESRMGSSYVVLSKNNRSQGLGISPRPRSAAAPHIELKQPPRPIEDSYIMLPPPAASIYKTSSSEGVGRQLLPPSVNSSSSMPGNNSGFFSSVTVLERAVEIATSQTQVKQPLCLECMRIFSDKMDSEIEDISSDFKAYEACLQHLEQESYNILSESDFQKKKQKEEEQKLRADIEEAEKQYSEVISEMKDLETKSKQFNKLKDKNWQEFNNIWFQWTSHQEEQDAILAKIEVSQANLELLKHTNVLNDAFYISEHGIFGTINNLRLGHSHEKENRAFEFLSICTDIGSSFMLRARITDINNKTYKLIDDDKIGGYRVVLGDFNTEENSTKALNNMLWDLKCVRDWGLV